MYISKKEKKLFEELDKNLKIPNYFYKFCSNLEKKHKLIIKRISGHYRNYHCDNCGKDFTPTNDYLSGEKCKCPSCKLELIVKSNRIKKFDQVDCVALMYEYKEYWVERCFEIKTWYSNGIYTSNVCEFARLIFNEEFDLEYEIINDNIFTGINCVSIIHKSFESNNWRYFISPWKSVGRCFLYIPENIKNICKNTRYHYSQLWKYVKHSDYTDLIDVLKYYEDSVEFLIKLGFYKLVPDHNLYENGKTFEDRFCVRKEFSSFIKKYNLDKNQLEVLSYVQKKDIKLINDLIDVRDDDIDYFCKKNINYNFIRKNINYSHEYRDYLNMCATLGYNMKDKKILYPDDLLAAHNKIQEQYRVNKDKFIAERVKKRYLELKHNEYKNKKYIIFPAQSTESLIDESKQQNNCVKTYAEKIAKEESDIYFMRLLENPIKSLVTVEVHNNKIVQKRTKNNQSTTSEQDKFLNLWEKKVLGGNS